MEKFLALVVEEINGEIVFEIKQISEKELSEGEVLIKSDYSSINYKDSLAVLKNGGVIRNYPMIPGIDVSGEVVSSQSDQFQPKDKVIVTSYGLGVAHTGGFSEYVRVPASWVVSLPKQLSVKDAMIIGTAGFTAALCVDGLEKHGLSENKEAHILVTGASGGVASLGIAMLNKLGYKNITALTRKKESAAVLEKLGASNVLLLDEFIPEKIRPLGKQEYDFVLDTVGGETLSAVLPLISYGGSAAICGNAGGINLKTTVLPFILRGINLLGIDSVNTDMKKRLTIWDRLATDLNITEQALVAEISLGQAPEIFTSLQKGQHIGRTIIKFD
ncbi:YhdH/YhfP family quinone oxidoreductase [Enterococcus sp. CWB-B31]|uniref:YhdH/YhfP family quinone oxidoreductase n=1 Tax=Enterococcus sp. CWB-B31 TaxID=2885159 RepID=UPI001E3838C2|nr:YhdH/YhfP family quinone oxidoreductase [Enterococcus sp. CWB-B31]MCB5955374.1 YhdH/YhfP family quinone oxidoreductase [Enterococcus sp. CWB-B31]